MPQDTGGILNLKKPVGSDDIRLQTIGIDLPYNFQKIDDAFTAHQAESAQKHITESGENANGRYVRFDDGTQICWVRWKESISVATVIGSGYRTDHITLDLPASFVDNYTSAYHVGGGGWYGWIIGAYAPNRFAIARFTSAESFLYDIRATFIGRWK